jgi:hypothetical protein
MNYFDDLERKISFSFSSADRYITKRTVERALQCSRFLQTIRVVGFWLALGIMLEALP